MSIEAMKQALEVLEHDNPAGRSATITALHQAIEQAEKQDADEWYEKALWGEKQEPVGWWNGRRTAWFDFEVDRPLDECKIPLYTAPPQREWVCKKFGDKNVD